MANFLKKVNRANLKRLDKLFGSFQVVSAHTCSCPTVVLYWFTQLPTHHVRVRKAQFKNIYNQDYLEISEESGHNTRLSWLM